MTSGTLRTILIVGAAVAAVSVAACKGSTAENTADNSAMATDNSTLSMSSNATNTAMAPDTSNAAMNATATAPMSSNAAGNSTAP